MSEEIRNLPAILSKMPLQKCTKSSLALLTDLYQLTMACGYWKKGLAEREACFHLFFRKPPFGGNFALAAGLQTALEFIQAFAFDVSDLNYLATLKGSDGAPLFEKGFLNYLKGFRFTCDLDALPEGTPVMPYEPLVRVQAPLIQAQLLESPLLNLINFQTLIATKAARICFAAQGDPVVEFGMRRAQGVDGALSASRAAFIGGCKMTSHLLAGKVFGIPVQGTQAHSFVMAFDREEEAFEAFAEVMPGNCVFLVDTYDSIEGTKRAIRVALKLKKRGVHIIGVRLDSGDLTALSVKIRRLLDEAGLYDAKIMASNELSEEAITDLKREGCKVDVWGVGTHLVTGKGQPALDGVYKLAAIRDPQGRWQYKLKISEKMEKMTDPGILDVVRFSKEGRRLLDVIVDVADVESIGEGVLLADPQKKIAIDSTWDRERLLKPILRKGRVVADLPSLQQIQAHSLDEQRRFSDAMRRIASPEPYPVAYERALFERKQRMVQEIQRENKQ